MHLNNKKNTIHFFGDSFTYGDGCRSGFEYYKTQPMDIINLWPNIVASNLDMNVNNKGVSGNSNSAIFRSVVNELSNINSGDVVVIGKSDSSRFELSINNQMNNFLVGLDYNSLDRYDKKINNLIKLYERYIQVPNYEFLDDELNSQFKNIISILNRLEVHTIKWCYHDLYINSDVLDFSLYEKIKEASDGKIEDYHFSWKGHLDFSNTILKHIKYEL